jgi:branched-chain amino acid aminotransferase
LKPERKWASLDGRLVPYETATVHIGAAAFKYAASVFEGVRGYWCPDGSRLRLFALEEHLGRFFDSLTLMRMAPGFGPEQVVMAIEELLAANELRQDCYVRLAGSAVGRGGIDTCGPVLLSIDAFPSGRKPGGAGIHVGVSSWLRIADATMPTALKCIANYHNGRLAKLQAQADGYDEALLLNDRGTIAEAPTACFFMVKQGRLRTPRLSDGILPSITRQVVCELAAARGLPIAEQPVKRSEAYLADEAFLCGTGAELLPVLSLDRIPLGSGAVGPITRRLMEAYFDAAYGRDPAFVDRAHGVRLAAQGVEA